jgi:hypothetical protein
MRWLRIKAHHDPRALGRDVKVSQKYAPPGEARSVWAPRGTEKARQNQSEIVPAYHSGADDVVIQPPDFTRQMSSLRVIHLPEYH